MSTRLHSVCYLSAVYIILCCPAFPEEVFRVGFDGTCVADFARGRAIPVATDNLDYVEGLRGNALRVGADARSMLSYAAEENISQREGTISFWFKPDAPMRKCQDRHTYLQTDIPKNRIGSGSIMVWSVDGRTRGDLSDDADRYSTNSEALEPERWNHVAFAWNGHSSRVYVNGTPSPDPMRRSDSAGPLAAAYGKKGAMAKLGQYRFSRREAPKLIHIGSLCGRQPMCGAMDELRIWDECLDEKSLREIWMQGAACPNKVAKALLCARRSYREVYAAMLDGHVNMLESKSTDDDFQATDLELVDSWKASGAVPAAASNFTAIGKCRIGALDGRAYLEAGPRCNDRFALRFRLDPCSVLHCFEIDIPDDAVRTADVIVQSCGNRLPAAAGSADYGLSVGYLTGDEYGNSGKMLTQRYLYWTRSDDVALIAMTARENRPAAIGAVRVYRIKAPHLPVAQVAEPPPSIDGSMRVFALYYEDPSIYGNFARGGDAINSSLELVDRVAALMKYTGQNALCYPAVWYQGLIGDDYMPRPHPPAYRELFYAAFDHEGLGFIPTVNPNEIEVPDGLITAQSVKDGSLHPSPVNILSTGEPNPGGWHSTPPNYNVLHPELQRQVFGWFDRLIEEGRNHPSFKGVCLHLTRHSPLWFGDLMGGYNDYAVESFAESAGVQISSSIHRDSPLRGKQYAEWLTKGHLDAWINWRCERVASFWMKLAERLRDACPNAKLIINTFLVVRPTDAEFGVPDMIERANRNAGLDMRKLKGVPNLAICQSVLPSDYRWYEPKMYGEDESGRKMAFQKELYGKPSDYSLLQGVAYPWVNQHDRYWESAAGNQARSGQSLDCQWMSEIKWRVSTLNPVGRHALRQYALPLRHGDVLAMSKGGFLIGTYGSEAVLIPWMRAFRSLPAVVMDDLFHGGDIVARNVRYKGEYYCYVVNTSEAAKVVTCDFPSRCKDTVTGHDVSKQRELRLEAYELRAYKAPEGVANFGIH